MNLLIWLFAISLVLFGLVNVLSRTESGARWLTQVRQWWEQRSHRS